MIQKKESLKIFKIAERIDKIIARRIVIKNEKEDKVNWRKYRNQTENLIDIRNELYDISNNE